jgi:hypothetical protein
MKNIVKIVCLIFCLQLNCFAQSNDEEQAFIKAQMINSSESFTAIVSNY